MQARISAKNAHAIAKAFDIDLTRKVKLSEGFVKHHVRRDCYLVRAYATKHQDNYYLVYEEESDALALMQEHCTRDDFCFRTLSFG